MRNPRLLAVFLLVASCSSTGPDLTPDYEELAWPSSEPRIGLQSLIPLRQGSARKTTRWMNRLVGKPTDTVGVARPFAVAWLGEHFVVSDIGGGQVVRVLPNGRIESKTVGDRFISPVGIANCDNSLFVSDSASEGVIELDANLKPLRWIVESLVQPTGLACSGDSLYVIETGRHKILEIDRASGTLRRELGERGSEAGQFNYPTAIAIGSDSIVVGDTLNFRIQRFDLTSHTFLNSFGVAGDAPGEMARIKGVAVDSKGQIWVTDALTDRVTLYGPDGTFLMSVGGHGSAPGQFSYPAGVAAGPDGRVAIVDSFNARLLVFEPRG